MIYTCKPKKIAHYINVGVNKSMEQAKAETGCDIILNSFLFDNAPCCNIKADGKILGLDTYIENGVEKVYNFKGYAWDADEPPVFTAEYDSKDNFLSCLALVDNGKAEQLWYNEKGDMGGTRGRTAIGFKADGTFVLWCAPDGKESKKVPEMQQIMLDLGCVNALLLDGGTSSGCITPKGSVKAARQYIMGYLCVWEEKPEGATQMAEKEMREKVVSTAKKWVGYSEASGKHKTIIDLYNNHKPLAVGYKVKYTDAWCATYVSAVFIAAGLADIAPTECSCPRMIELYKAKKRWVESDAYIPSPGDIVMYDWQDTGTGDNVGVADHVGIVVSVSGNTMQIIEGNYNNSVGYRSLAVNGRYIRGYCLPDYGNAPKDATESQNSTSTAVSSGVNVNIPILRKGAKNESVRALQILLNGRGYNCGNADADFGNKTDAALRKYQKANKLTVSGVADAEVWNSILK